MTIDNQLYRQILQNMPIPCVDLLAVDVCNRILLTKRNNEPAKGLWWFPGGRVHYKETRCDAALRKLKEECNLAAATVQELGTYDVLLDNPLLGTVSHGITTVFLTTVENLDTLQLDCQSCDVDWRIPEEWLTAEIHPFVFWVISNYDRGLLSSR